MSIKERKLTGGEKRSKEANFKKLKKQKGDFKDRYGKDAESVMHAVATNQAKNEDTYDPHMMYKGTEKEYRAFKPKEKDHHDRLMSTGYDHDDPETKKVEEADVTKGYMDHMKKVNKGEINKYPMRGKGKPLSQARKDAIFGKKKKDTDYVEEKASYKSDPKLKNLRLSDIPSDYEKRKYAAQGAKKNEDVSADLPTTNQRTQRMLNLIRANNPTAKNDFEAILLSLAKAKKNLSNDEDQADISKLRKDVDGLKLIHNQLQAKVDGLNESASLITEAQFDEAAGEKDACYHKVKSRYKVWPSAYASGALVQCRKKGAKNWGNSKK